MMNNRSTGGISHSRFGQIKKVRKEVEANLPEDILTGRLEAGQTKDKAFEQYAEGIKLELDARRTEIRKRVSEVMHQTDQKELTEAELEVIRQRQINRYYRFEIEDSEIYGHIEASHGIKPSSEVAQWCAQKSVVDYETGTAEIAGKGMNRMIFSRPRLFADVNHLPENIRSSLRSEGAVYTKEDNLNAVKAQRDLTALILRQSHNLDKDGIAINPHLAIYFHGKVDSRGHDFEIGAKQRDGKGPLDPRVAFWVAEKLANKLEQRKDIKNFKGESPTINVVAYGGAYSGSPALTRMRKGDDLLGFKGFGDMLQCMQLECSKHLRKEFPQQVAEILNEIIVDFSREFKSPDDFNELEYLVAKFEEKMSFEKADLFNPKNIGYLEELGENTIALSKTLREELDTEVGGQVVFNGVTFKAMGMKKEHLKSGKTIMMHPKYRQ